MAQTQNQSSCFRFGPGVEIFRLGYGTMQLTGPGVWGPPADRGAALRTLKCLRDLGVNFVDTADSYGPNYAEELVREALHPYGDIVVATKAGLAKPGPNHWVPLGRPEYLIQQAHTSARRLDASGLAAGRDSEKTQCYAKPDRTCVAPAD